MESRIRQLVMKLEYVESLTLAHPFIRGFDQVLYCLTDQELKAAAQGEVSETLAKRKKEDIEGKEGSKVVYTTTFYIGLAIEPKQRASTRALSEHAGGSLAETREAGATGPRKLDISHPTTEFNRQVRMWDKFDEATMGIAVRHIKRYPLGRISDPCADVISLVLHCLTTSLTKANGNRAAKSGRRRRYVLLRTTGIIVANRL